MSSLQDTIFKVANPDQIVYYADLTPHDSNIVNQKTIILGVNGSGASGDIVVEQQDGTEFTFTNVKAGASFFITPVKVLDTGTTATGLFTMVTA